MAVGGWFFFLPKPNTSPVLVSRLFKRFPSAQGMTDCGNPAAEVLCEGSRSAGRLPVSGKLPACCWATCFLSLGLIRIINIFLPVWGFGEDMVAIASG